MTAAEQRDQGPDLSVLSVRPIGEVPEQMDQPSAPPSRSAVGGRARPHLIAPRAVPGDVGPLAPASVSQPRLEEPITSGSIPVLTPAQTALLTATERLRNELADLAFPFGSSGAVQGLHERDDVLERLDTFVLPRLRRIDAPLLVVVGGSAGSGKSTLTNSLVGGRVSPEGVLRPTTRVPVLAHHPRDAGAFLSRRILPGLTRTTVSGEQSPEPGGDRQPASGSIRLVPHWAVAPGLAIIDSPDLNSWVEGNRELARQLFGVADLWVFVATGTDYANAAPWELLAEAVERQVSVAVVLNRIRDHEAGDVRHHFATMLRDAGLASAAFFTMPETALSDGMLPSWRMVAMQTWLARQVSDAQARDGHVRRAVVGTLAYVGRRCEPLVGLARTQAEIERELRADVDAVLGPVLQQVSRQVADGSMIGPEVEAAWREIAGREEAASRGGRWRTRTSSPQGLHPADRTLAAADALRAGMVALLRSQSQVALTRLADRWHGYAAVAGMGAEAGLFALPGDFDERAEQLLLRWQRKVESRVIGTRSGTGAPSPAGAAAAVAVMTLAVGADAGWIGSPARAWAESRLPRGEIRDLVRWAGEQLHAVLVDLLELAVGRPRAMLDEVGPGSERPEALRGCVEEVKRALGAVP